MRGALGVVVIGRNEGERLVRCLDSLVAAGRPIVYVDSGSTDKSRTVARERGVEVVELDLSVPFTAARARNAGVERLLASRAAIDHVQFVDGDCELHPEWLARAVAELERDPKNGVVCGRRRERFPDASVYNRLCDLEWDTPVGEALACGGDALMRLEAFRAAGGFDPGLIAGEEPELCFRIRRAGFRVLRIDAEMTLHDAAMRSFGQWWSRTLRAGHAAAEGAWMHGREGERRARRRVVSAFFWAWGVPLGVVAAAVVAGMLEEPLVLAAALALAALGYTVLLLRVHSGRRRRGASSPHARLYAAACLVGKWPESAGMLRFARNRLRGRRATLIEYKGAPGDA